MECKKCSRKMVLIRTEFPYFNVMTNVFYCPECKLEVEKDHVQKVKGEGRYEG